MSSENTAWYRIYKILEFFGKEKSELTTYATEDNISSSHIKICVDELGEIPFPLTAKTLESLIKKASPAHFGHKDKTLLDKTVRNTLEIKKDQLQVDIDPSILQKVMETARDALGLSSSVRLVPQLHNLLIYNEGCFFKKHQDTEKLPNMIASLVIALPCPHIGGDLEISHDKITHIFKSENLNESNASCVTFYADCIHEVKPVRKGSRITLTYNIVLEDNPSFIKEEDPLPKSLLEDLRECIKDNNPAFPYFLLILDHTYSKKGLTWSLLKGADRRRVALLRKAAEKLGMMAHLGQLEVHESRDASCYDEEDVEEVCPESLDLLCTDFSYSNWIDEKGKSSAYDYHFYAKQIMEFVPIASYKPSNAEYEGYMGNYGCTMEYWYDRAVFILWPKETDIYMKLRADHLMYLQDLQKQLKDSKDSAANQQRLCELIDATASDDIYRRIDQEGRNLIMNMLIDYADPIQAKEFLRKSPVLNQIFSLYKGCGLNFAKLEKAFGHPFFLENFQEKLQQYSGKPQDYHGSFLEMQQAHVSRDALKLLLTANLYHLKKRTTITSYDSYQKVIDHINHFFDDTFFIQAEDIVSEGISFLVENPLKLPLTDLVVLHEKISQNEIGKSCCHSLKNKIKEEITSEIAFYEKNQNKWALREKSECNCNICCTVTKFLKNADEEEMMLSIVKDERNHVVAKLKVEDRNLPLLFQTLRKGSPHKLLIRKTEELHLRQNEALRILKAFQAKIHED